ncbi:hypothetical protein B0H19DRAFT_1123165, partial [Mycena capillaripes]
MGVHNSILPSPPLQTRSPRHRLVGDVCDGLEWCPSGVPAAPHLARLHGCQRFQRSWGILWNPLVLRPMPAPPP